jgi:protein tyrosine phosphatase
LLIEYYIFFQSKTFLIISQSWNCGKVQWSLSVNTAVTFDPFVLTTKTVECISDDYVRYTVDAACGKEKHTVTINHYTGWPDFGVPENVDEIADIVKDLINAPDPVVLHCSAGRGRAGVVVSALRVLNTGETISEAVETVRKDRTGMVQTGGQYYFLKKLVSELKVTSK